MTAARFARLRDEHPLAFGSKAKGGKGAMEKGCETARQACAGCMPSGPAWPTGTSPMMRCSGSRSSRVAEPPHCLVFVWPSFSNPCDSWTRPLVLAARHTPCDR